MLDAAYELFCTQGFRATTMQAIAERAGVAVQTLYFTFHTKDSLLQEVQDRAVLGDERVRPALQDWWQAATVEADLTRALTIVVDGISAIAARTAPLLPVYYEVSADPVGAVYRQTEELRYDGYRRLVGVLEAKRSLRAEVSHAQATDLLFALLGPALYRTLVIERGWSQKQWARWVTATLLWDLFGVEG